MTIALTVAGCPLRVELRGSGAREHVGGARGRRARCRSTFDVMSPEERAALTTQLRGGVEPAESRSSSTRDARDRRRLGQGRRRQVVARPSNLAAALRAARPEVGVLDADIYGHSIPHMLGIQQKPVLVDKLIVPPVAHDLKLMSIGFFLDDNAPVMWRGPMLHRALEQFLQDVHWGELDVLVVDMPPGTGDVSISLGQLLPRAEAVVVTTPQLLAQEVASRAAEMAQKTGMRLLGVIENMTSEVFGSGGGERLADELERAAARLRFRSTRALRESGDAGDAARASREPDSDPAAGDLRDRRARSTRAAAAASPRRCRSSPCTRGRPAAPRGARLLAPHDVEVLAAHFLDAEAPGRTGHGVRRIEWLETLGGARAGGPPAARRLGAGLRALGRQRRARLPDAPRGRATRSSQTRRRARGSSSAADVPDGRARLLDAPPRRRRSRRGAHRHLAAAARPSRRRPEADRHEPALDRDPVVATASPVVADVSMGNLTYGDVLAGPRARGRARPVRRRARAQGVRARRGLQLLVDALTPDDGYGAVLLVARPEARPRACAARARGRRPPARRYPLGKPGSWRIASKSVSVCAAVARSAVELAGLAADAASASWCRPPRASGTPG